MARLVSQAGSKLGACILDRKAPRMTQQHPFKTWTARYKAEQVSIHESDLHQIWISSIEVRKVVPRLRADPALLDAYPADFMQLDRGPCHFFSERALTLELKRVRSQEALMFLAWLEKAVYYPVARKRGSAPALKPMPAKQFADAEDESWHIPRVKAPPVTRPRRPTPTASATANSGLVATHVAQPLARRWRGEESLRRTLVGGAIAMAGWTIAIVLMVLAVTPSASRGKQAVICG